MDINDERQLLRRRAADLAASIYQLKQAAASHRDQYIRYSASQLLPDTERERADVLAKLRAIEAQLSQPTAV